ncbi:ParB N-terminal domain-containing protein [Paraburkholderia sediminicola]|uniref:ParB N-terminal domain-containing protein n=1 Tax=Paraburkholderia sediminicola TaxID=458836 RepID=UPI0038BA8288
MNDLQLHPLCTWFPLISGAEFEALKADIQIQGLRQPIVIHEGQILDGGNRYRACIEIGVEPATVEFAGDDPVSFVLSSNLHRRHLSAGQQAAIVAGAQDWGRSQTVGGDGSNQHKSKAATLPDSSMPRDTVASRVARSGTSERTQRMADQVAKESRDLLKKVAHGKLSLLKAIKLITPTKPVVVPAAPAVQPEPEAPAGEYGPSAEELAYQDECEKADQNAYNALVEVSQSDDRLAAALKLVADQAREIGRLKALVRTLEESRDGRMNQCNQHIRMIKSLERKLKKYEQATA